MNGFEFDFATIEGREAARKEIARMVNSEDKTELTNFLFSMMDFIAIHEIKFANLKEVL